jgi:hypothetical protein
MRLLENHVTDPEGTRVTSRFTLVGIILVSLAVVAIALWIVVKVISALVHLVS